MTTSGTAVRVMLTLALVAMGSWVKAQEPLPPPPDGNPLPPPAFALLLSGDVRVGACVPTGTPVSYPVPVLITPCLSNMAPVVCQPAPGTLFPVGLTTVECAVATDCGERSNVTFTVSVVLDTASPVLVCPADRVVYATTTNGVVVEYPAPEASDDADPAPAVTCAPAPGATLPVGLTRVECTVVDACGRTGSCAFQIEVRRAEMRLERTTVPDGAGGRLPAVVVTPAGFEGLDVATEVGGDWEPLGGAPLTEALGLAAAKFYRPPIVEGVKRAPQGEIAYVAVGLLAAYATPGLSPARALTDNQTDFGVKLLAGDEGGSGANRWSGVKNLPFTFHYFGRPCKNFRVSKNGLLTFSTNLANDTIGLGYFNFVQTNITNILISPLPLPPASFPVDDTIFCMAGRHVTQTPADDVYGYLHGTAPYRQVWVIFRHAKDFYGRTTTGIVLEETSNRILLMDMDTDVRNISTNRLLAGIQGKAGDLREVAQVPATPLVRLMGGDASLADNGCYLFRPYVLGQPVTGQAAPALMAATNLDLYLSEQFRARNIPGATVAVSRNGRLIFNKAYGWANVEKGEKMQPYHRACIGSVSKVLAAIGVEKLIDQGALPGLNAWPYASNRLGKTWFWAGVNQGVTNGLHSNFGATNFLANLTNTTLRHLLSHTAAFSNRNDDLGATTAYASGDYTQLTAQDQVQWFMATNPQLTNGVGLAVRYSNPTWKQVGVLIEEVAGQSFESWMLANVMNPAGIHHARLMRTYENQETWRDARRYTHTSGDPPWWFSRITGAFGPVTYGDAIYNNAADGAAGSWTATAADLVRLLAAVDHLPNRPDILATGRINEFDLPAFPMLGNDQGIGWDNVTSSVTEKNGNIGYGSSFLMRSRGPDRLTVAIVCNSGAGPDTVARGVYNAVAPLPAISPFYDLWGLQLNIND